MLISAILLTSSVTVVTFILERDCNADGDSCLVGSEDHFEITPGIISVEFEG